MSRTFNTLPYFVAYERVTGKKLEPYSSSECSSNEFLDRLAAGESFSSFNLYPNSVSRYKATTDGGTVSYKVHSVGRVPISYVGDSREAAYAYDSPETRELFKVLAQHNPQRYAGKKFGGLFIGDLIDIECHKLNETDKGITTLIVTPSQLGGVSAVFIFIPSQVLVTPPISLRHFDDISSRENIDIIKKSAQASSSSKLIGSWSKQEHRARRTSQRSQLTEAVKLLRAGVDCDTIDFNKDSGKDFTSY